MHSKFWKNAVIPEWFEEAACKGNTELFFPERGSDQFRAKAICKACPVFQNCRKWALNLPPDTLGIYAGMSQRERVRLQRVQYYGSERPFAGKEFPTREQKTRRFGQG